jgi:drug/metabolite transporter (DMT)-like permease
VIAPFARSLGPATPAKGDWRLMLAMVLFQPCLYFLFESYALKFTTSSQAGIIAASLPLMVAFGAKLALGEILEPRKVAGLVLAMLGVVALTLAGDGGGAAENAALGNVLELLAMMSAAGYMILVKMLCSRFAPWRLTAMQMLAGAVFFVPGLAHLLRAGLPAWTLGLALAMIFLGVFVTLGAFGLYNWGTSRIPASRASAFVNLVPVVAVALGWSVLGEGLNGIQLAAGAVVVGGVWMSQQGRKRKHKQP